MTNLALATPATDQPAHPISALALVETVTAVQVFTESGLDNIIERIEQEARTTALDISTAKGRKEIASLAHKIAQSKTALDKMGKELVSGWKEQAKKVDLERARAWDRLEALQKEIRQPLTDWENREKERVAGHEQRLGSIASSATYIASNWLSLSADAMQKQVDELKNDQRDWQESTRAQLANETAISTVTAAIIKRQKHDSEQAELARLRKEEEERKQREHEERLKAEAAEKARKEAEEKARKAADAEAARVKSEQEKAEKERQRIQKEKDAAEAKAKRDAEEAAGREEKIKREKAEADARAAKAEKERIAAEAKAKEDARIAAEKAAADQKAAEQAAAKRERDRIAAEKKAEADAKAKREADKAHRAKVNNEALNAFTAAGISPQDARHAIELIAQGHIPHITISY